MGATSLKFRTLWETLLRLSALVYVTVTSACIHENHPPTANAGSDMIVDVGSTVLLDGRQSSDVDGDRLRYAWNFVDKPESSTAQFSNSSSRTPSFVADKVGDYVVQLVVRDKDDESKPDFVHIMTFNRAPVAAASYSSDTIIGAPVFLDGSGSMDPESQVLFYQWQLVLAPAQSQATILQPNSINTEITPDYPGVYVIHLTVNDGEHPSAPSMLVLEVEEPMRIVNRLPVAEAGADIPLRQTGSVQLDGSASFDPENDALIYAWSLLLKPLASNATLFDGNSPNPSLDVDVMGSYVAQLVVNDGAGDSHVDTVVITPHDEPQLACGDCHDGNQATGKPSTHQLTYDDCRNCHLPNAWRALVGRFHAHGHRAQPAECSVCHNGVAATGMPANHIRTTLECNRCHILNNTTWLPASSTPQNPVFDHTGIFSGCVECHNGVQQTGKAFGHANTSERCNACHETDSWLPAVHLEHLQPFDNRCNECHTTAISRKTRP